MPKTFPLRMVAGSLAETAWHANGGFPESQRRATVRLIANEGHFVMREPAEQGGVSPAADQGQEATDRSLLARAAGGDTSAFDRLVERHQGFVLGLADRLLSGKSEADDVAQEALVKLWQSAATLKLDDRGAGPWLRRVVSNLCVDRLRKSGRLRPLDENVPEPAVPATQLKALEATTDLEMRLERAMQSLPDRQRVALTLFHLEDASMAAVAKHLDTSVEAVESLLARARRSLRKLLEPDRDDLMGDSS